MKSWIVELTPDADSRLRADIRSGAITRLDIEVIHRWIRDVEDKGLDYAQHSPDWRDHELDGEWRHHRAVSFSYAGRIIYQLIGDRLVVEVVRVTARHDYKKKRSLWLIEE